MGLMQLRDLNQSYIAMHLKCVNALDIFIRNHLADSDDDTN